MYYLITELHFYFCDPCNLIKKITYIHEMYCATKRLPFPVDVVSLVGIVALVSSAADVVL